MIRLSRIATVAVVFLLAVATTATAAPGSDPVEGVIVEKSEGEVVADLGKNDGIPQGADVEVFRRLEVEHPVSGETIVDRFPIGRMELTQVGERLSISSDWTGLSRVPKPGDYVVYTPAAPKPEPKQPEDAAVSTPEPEEADATAPPPRRSPDQRAAERAFQRTLGRPLTERIIIWEDFLKEYPDSPYAAKAEKELKWLRSRLAEQRREMDEPIPEKPKGPPPLSGVVTGPNRVDAGMPLEIDAAVDRPPYIEKLRVLVRREDAPDFETVEMKRVGDFNWRGRLDQTWSEPGKIYYFVEAIREDGTLEQLEETGTTHVIRVVEPAPDPLPSDDRSRASALFDYVDFKSGEGDDRYLRFEADYRYAVDVFLLEAFGVGVGIFDGEGNTVEAIEAGEESRQLNLSYGFADAEFGIHDYVGISGRFLVGNQEASDRDTFTSAFGFHGELRIGESQGTRLLLGTAFTEEIGVESWIRLYIDAIENVPMHGEAVVTNLPVGEDLGVSLNYGVGYEFTDWFALMGRFGWNARKIDYHGPSVGVGTVLTW